MEPFFDGPDWDFTPAYFEVLPALHRHRGPTALGGIEVFGIIVGSIGTCFAKKIFDEVYERTLKRPIGAQFDRFFSKISVPAGKAVEYRDIIHFEDIDLVVVIRATVDEKSTKEAQLQVMQAHRIAHSYIQQYGRKAPIHCHKIVNGLIAVEPDFFRTLEEIQQDARARLKVSVHK